MTCREVQQKLPLLAVNDLDETEAQDIRRHLAACDACRGTYEELRATVGLLKEGFAAEPVLTLDEVRRSELMAQSGAAAQTTGDLPGDEQHRTPRRKARGRMSVAAFPLVLKAAAALVLVAAVGIMLRPAFKKWRQQAEDGSSVARKEITKDTSSPSPATETETSRSDEKLRASHSEATRALKADKLGLAEENTVPLNGLAAGARREETADIESADSEPARAGEKKEAWGRTTPPAEKEAPLADISALDKGRAAASSEMSEQHTMRDRRRQTEPRKTEAAFSVGGAVRKPKQLPARPNVSQQALINTFRYSYPKPREETLRVKAILGPSPLAPREYLLQVGVQTPNAAGNAQAEAVAENVSVAAVFNDDTVARARLLGEAPPDGKLSPVTAEILRHGESLTAVYGVTFRQGTVNGREAVAVADVRVQYNHAQTGATESLRLEVTTARLRTQTRAEATDLTVAAAAAALAKTEQGGDATEQRSLDAVERVLKNAPADDAQVQKLLRLVKRSRSRNK